MAAYVLATVGGGGSSFTITVTYTEDCYGQVITATKGTKTLSKTATSSGSVEFNVSEAGEWTISVTLDGSTFSQKVNVVDEYPMELETVPDGVTVTPVNNVQTWLKCAGIRDKTYTALAEVLEDEETFIALCADSNACNYMARSTNWASGVADDSTAMLIVGKYNYCANALLGDSTWATAIAGSTYYDYVCTDAVPTMTSNTTPSGTCFASSVYDSSYTAYSVFNRKHGSANPHNEWVTPSGTRTGFVGYIYPYTIPIPKIISISNADRSDFTILSSAILQASNDTTNGTDGTWTDIQTISSGLPTTQNETKYYNITSESTTKYKAFRIYATVSSSYSFVMIGELQFFGRTDNANYIPLVPNLTSNTSAESSVGVAMGTSVYGTNYDYWQAFAQGITNTQNNGRYGWIPNTSSTPYICAMHFNTPRKAAQIRVARKSNTATTIIKAVGSSDGTNWVDISDNVTINSDTTSVTTDWTYPYTGVINITSDDEYEYIGIQVVSSSIAIDSGGGYRFEIYSIAEGIAIHSAANDTVYYLNNGSPVLICTTNEAGKGYADSSSIPAGVYSIYSTVAKNPDNLSEAYSKSIRITNTVKGGTTEMYVMPNKALYWWGVKDKNLETCSVSNGWESLAWQEPTYNINNISLITDSTHYKGVGTKDKIDITTLYTIGRETSASAPLVTIWDALTKVSGQMVNKTYYSSSYDCKTLNITLTKPYICISAGRNANCEIDAIWYE